MPRRASNHPTELELDILRIIWQRGPSTIRELCTALQRPSDFTAILTIVKIMVKKRYLEVERRTRGEGGTLYRAAVQRSRTAFSMFESLARRFFDGSVATAIQRLIDAGEIKRSEVDELRKLMNEKGKGRTP